MVTAADPHQYETAIATMPRKKLEEFALQAARAMEVLEQENMQLTQDVDDAKKIDMDVINGWRDWTQVIDEEREKWAAMATRLSEENQGANAELQQAVQVIETLLELLGNIASMAEEDSEDGSNAKSMRRGLKKIAKMSNAAIARYAVVEEEEPDDSRPDDEKTDEEAPPDDEPS
jgi:D-ribose pyranose/furanose isomerase RbsD